MMPLGYIAWKLREIWSSSFELKWFRKWKSCCDSSEISLFWFIWHTGVLKSIRISQFWFQLFNRQSLLHILWKFRQIWISDPRVSGERSVTKLWQNYLPPCTCRSVIPERNGYCYLNERINSAIDASILCESFVKFGPVIFELKGSRKWKLCCDSSEISRFSFIWHTGVLKRIAISQFWFQQVNRLSLLHIWWKFSEIRISDPGVLGERSCMAGVYNCCHA